MEFILRYFTPVTSVLQIVLLAFLALSFVIQLYYYLFVFLKLARVKINPEVNQLHALSVVICARNEAENLREYLPAVLEQDYPDYEVVVVNDCSYDETEIVLAQLKQKYSHLKISTIVEDERFKHGKKLALTVGIKAAINEHLVLTDADCVPASNQWLKQMVAGFNNTESEIVLGYGKYKSEKSLLNKLIRFDALFIAIQYFSYALRGNAYMGVGRNMAYKKSTFFKNKGFASHLKLNSGDDDLFVNENANSTNTSIVVSHESHTISEPKKDYEAWATQKRRHLTTGKYYKKNHKIWLGLEVVTRIIFYVSIFMTLFYLNIIGFAISLFIIRLVIQMIIIKLSMNKLNEKDLLLYSPIFDFVLPFLNINFFVSNYFIVKRNRWK